MAGRVRIAHTADVHLGITRYGTDVGGRNSRVNDFADTLRRFARQAVLADAGYAVLAGDTFHTRRPGPLELKVLVESLTYMTKHGIHVVVGPGNHDGMGSIADPETHTLGWMAALDMPHVHVFAQPTVTRVGDLIVASLPYPHKRSIESSASLLDRTTQASLVVEATIRQMAGIAADKRREGALFTLFVGHLSTIGARLGSEGGMQMGWDTTIDPDCLEGFDYAALGHIHVQQQVAPNAWYAGAPDLHDFSDVGRRPSFLIADLEVGSLQIRRVETGAREIVLCEVLELDGWPALPSYRPDVEDAMTRGAVVRLDLVQTNIKLPPEVVRRYVADMRERGASWIKVNAVKPAAATRSRVEMGTEDDVITATERWLQLQQVEPEPVLALARELVAPFRTE